MLNRRATGTVGDGTAAACGVEGTSAVGQRTRANAACSIEAVVGAVLITVVVSAPAAIPAAVVVMPARSPTPVTPVIGMVPTPKRAVPTAPRAPRPAVAPAVVPEERVVVVWIVKIVVGTPRIDKVPIIRTADGNAYTGAAEAQDATAVVVILVVAVGFVEGLLGLVVATLRLVRTVVTSRAAVVFVVIAAVVVIDLDGRILRHDGHRSLADMSRTLSLLLFPGREVHVVIVLGKHEGRQHQQHCQK